MWKWLSAGLQHVSYCEMGEGVWKKSCTSTCGQWGLQHNSLSRKLRLQVDVSGLCVFAFMESYFTRVNWMRFLVDALCVCVCVCVCVCMHTLSHVLLFVTPWTVAQQAPLSMEFSRQEYWIILPFPSPGGLPNWRICISHVSCIGQQVLYQLSHQGSPTKRRQFYIMLIYINGVGTCQCFPKH